MKLVIQTILLILILACGKAQAQVSYFPPNLGTTWDTLSPASLGWCPDRIDSLYQYLEAKSTDAFIVLIDGKIVLEKYFGTYTRDSVHYWASAGKSLTSMMVGIAQEKGLLDINNPASQYLGTGWTGETTAKENLITVRHLLTMNSGLDDTPTGGCTNEDTTPVCLQYKADAGTRWAYHTGAYRKLESIVSAVNGTTYTAATNSFIGSHIGMIGLWYNGVYYSNARSMARFGLLMLNKGVWNSDTVLHDTAYYNAMIHTSQSFNLSYGYLWWLNGKASCMLPQTQLVFPGAIVPNAPADMFCALGKNDQKIYVVPSRKMVVVRQGETSGTPLLALSSFDNEVWRYIDSLPCVTTNITEMKQDHVIKVFPNPAKEELHIVSDGTLGSIMVYNAMGNRVMKYDNHTGTARSVTLQIQDLPQGLYLLQSDNGFSYKFYKE